MNVEPTGVVVGVDGYAVHIGGLSEGQFKRMLVRSADSVLDEVDRCLCKPHVVGLGVERHPVPPCAKHGGLFDLVGRLNAQRIGILAHEHIGAEGHRLRCGGNRVHDARAGVVNLEGERRASVVGIAIHIEQHETVVVAGIVGGIGHAATLVAHKHTHNIVGVVARLSVLALGAEQLEGIALVALKLGALPFHRDRFLENLLPSCKVLNISTPQKQKQPRETNWKQKIQKPQNENICLTYLNTENKRNFHFLSFCCALLKVQNQVL